jgi:hypothetical protein
MLHHLFQLERAALRIFGNTECGTEVNETGLPTE